MIRHLALVVCFGALSSCALGVGAIPNVSSTVGASRATEQEVVGSGPGYILVRAVSGKALNEGFHLPIGLSAGMMPSLTIFLPGGGPSSPLQATTSVGWTAHADLYIPVPLERGPTLGVTLQYLNDSMSGRWAGDFELSSRSHGVMGFVGVGLGPIGLELGGGGLFLGKAGVGDVGNILADDRSLISSDASGFRAALRATLFISGGGDLQMKTAVRLQAGYQHLFTATQIPAVSPGVGGLHFGFDLMLSFF